MSPLSRIPALLLAGLLLSGCAGPDVMPAPYSFPTPGVTPTAAPTPTPEPTPEPYDYSLPAPKSGEVDDGWFSDAVFIGDSLTDGLRLYGGITGAGFICYKGLTSYEFDSKKCITLDGRRVTALEALKSRSYGKVFLMLGLNELGTNAQSFAEEYALLIDAVRAAQPEAVLYFQLVAPVNDKKCREKGQAHYFNNEKVAAFNAEILRLCGEKEVVCLDLSQELTDEEGQLPYDKATDGIHFTKDWYQQWYAFLKTHTVDPERLEEYIDEPAPPPVSTPSASPSAQSVSLVLRR